MTHGVRSERRVGEVAAQFEVALRNSAATPAWLLDGRFDFQIRRWARAEAACLLLDEWLDRVTIGEAASELVNATETERNTAPGRVKRRVRQSKTSPVLTELRQWDARAERARRELGLTPASYAALARDVSLAGREQEDALGRLASQGAAIREQRRGALRVIPAETPADPALPAAGG